MTDIDKNQINRSHFWTMSIAIASSFFALYLSTLFLQGSPNNDVEEIPDGKWTPYLSHESFPVKAGVDLSVKFDRAEHCCKGTYKFAIPKAKHSLGLEGLFFPAVGCGQRVTIGSYSFDISDNRFSNVGPVIPILNNPAGERPTQLDISIDCPRVNFAGLWKGPVVVDDYMRLVERREKAKIVQTYVPIGFAIAFLCFGIAFLATHYGTGKKLEAYRDIGLGLILWTVFLVFLSGLGRSLNFTFAAYAHMPIRILAGFGIFLSLRAYLMNFLGTKIILRPGSSTTGGLVVILSAFVLGLELVGKWNAAMIVTAFALCVVYWPIILLRTSPVQITSLRFLLIFIVIFAFLGNLSDAVKVVTWQYGVRHPLPYFNRITIDLFMGTAVVVLVSDYVKNFRRLQEEMIRSAKAHAIARVIKMLAHDVRAPFQNIRIGLGMLNKCALEAPKTAQIASSLLVDFEGKVRRLDAMLRDIMDFSRMTKLHLSTVDAARLLNDVVDDFRSRYPDRKIEVLATSHTTTLMDPTKIYRVLANILENAIQATSLDDEVSATMSRHTDTNSLAFKIFNTGSYIGPDQRSKIFEEFYTSSKPNGTGLGLAICKDFVTAHGGSIECTSTAGKGTLFTVNLPIHVSDPESIDTLRNEQMK